MRWVNCDLVCGRSRTFGLQNCQSTHSTSIFFCTNVGNGLDHSAVQLGIMNGTETRRFQNLVTALRRFLDAVGAVPPGGIFLVLPQERYERRALRGDAEPSRSPHKEPMKKHRRAPSGIFSAWPALKILAIHPVFLRIFTLPVKKSVRWATSSGFIIASFEPPPLGAHLGRMVQCFGAARKAPLWG